MKCSAKERWRLYRRNARLFFISVYSDDEGRIHSYEDRLKGEKYFALAIRANTYDNHPNSIPYLWDWVKHVRRQGGSIEATRNAVRSYMERNTRADGRKAATNAHPAYLKQYEK